MGARAPTCIATILIINQILPKHCFFLMTIESGKDLGTQDVSRNKVDSTTIEAAKHQKLNSMMRYPPSELYVPYCPGPRLDKV